MQEREERERFLFAGISDTSSLLYMQCSLRIILDTVEDILDPFNLKIFEW